MTTECHPAYLDFPMLGSRHVLADFDGGDISSDGGALLLRETERLTGIIRQFAACFNDHRDPDRIEHTVEELVSQRVYGLALGYENLEKANLRGVEVVSPSMPPKGSEQERATLEHFELDEHGLVARGPQGHTPILTGAGKDKLQVLFEATTCAPAPSGRLVVPRRWPARSHVTSTLAIASASVSDDSTTGRTNSGGVIAGVPGSRGPCRGSSIRWAWRAYAFGVEPRSVMRRSCAPGVEHSSSRGLQGRLLRGRGGHIRSSRSVER